MKHIACIGVGLVLMSAGIPAGAQNQAPSTSQTSSPGSSLGDYARQIRKDPGAKATPKVFDNDNLPKTDKLSVVGQKPAPASEDSAKTKAPEPGNASAAPNDAKAAGDKTTTETKPGSEAKTGADKTGADKTANSEAKSPQDEATKQAAAKQWGDKIAAQKEQVDLLARELDVLQREYQIRAAAMYADAGNRMRNEVNWDKQDTQYKQQIADKQKVLDDAKQKLDDLQEDARKAGAPASVSEQ